MRAAMADAVVGDDVYGEDPTLLELEGEVAAMFGHEAALFVPSGTMGNLIALQLSAGPGEEILAESNAHIVTYELGGLAMLGGVQTRTVAGIAGLLDVSLVEAALRPPGWGTVVTKVVAVEQTHNRGGGTVHPLGELQALRALVHEHGARLHCDGARIWNAAIATGTPLRDYGGVFDTLSVCLSKGLGAPVGSLVVASAADIAVARTLRKRLGGGMRQAGVLAAAGLVAIREHLDRLADDHARARRLAAALGLAEPQTNIVIATVPDARDFVAAAVAGGVRVSAVGPTRVRFLTHLDITDDDIDRAVVTLAPLLQTVKA
jgi:threonine aldolase